MFQNQQAEREQIFGLKMQLDMINFNAAVQNQMCGINLALQSFSLQSPAYPTSLCGEMGGAGCGSGSILYTSQLANCCCNQQWR